MFGCDVFMFEHCLLVTGVLFTLKTLQDAGLSAMSSTLYDSVHSGAASPSKHSPLPPTLHPVSDPVKFQTSFEASPYGPFETGMIEWCGLYLCLSPRSM